MKCSRCGAFASRKGICDCDEAESHKADEITALKLALVEMTAFRDEAIAEHLARRIVRHEHNCSGYHYCPGSGWKHWPSDAGEDPMGGSMTEHSGFSECNAADERIDDLARQLSEANTVIAHQVEQLAEVTANSRRYERLRILGVAIGGDLTKHLDTGTVACCTTLDRIVDADIALHPSRGEQRAVGKKST